MNNQIPNKLDPMGIGELPTGYTRVKALRCEVRNAGIFNDMGSYIEWFSSFDASYRIDMTFRFYKTVYYQYNWCSDDRNMPRHAVMFGIFHGVFRFLVKPPTDNEYITLPSDLLKHTISFDIPNGIYMLDGNIIGTFTPEPHVWDFVFTLGAWAISNNGTTYTPYEYCAEEIYECSAYKNGVLCSKLIPCLDQNNRPCMYDTIRKITLYNRGPLEFSVIIV